MAREIENRVSRSIQMFPPWPSKLTGSICLVAPLLASLLIANHSVASAAESACVVKLQFSAGEKADVGTSTFVKQVLDTEGYKVIDDWLFTMWSHSDYAVTIVVTHTEVPNYGFPVDLAAIQLSIADGSGKVLVNNYIDRADLEATLRSYIPACGAASPADPNPSQDVNAQQ